MKTKMPLMVIGLLLCCAACKPVNIIQLYRCELADNLKDSTLIVLLEDHSADIQLLKKYNKPKEADKLIKEDSLNNANIKQAFVENYNYSAYEFVNKELTKPSPTKTYAVFSTDKGGPTEESLNNEFVTRLTIVNASRTLTFDANGMMTKQAIGYVVKQANEKLHSLYELAQKQKSKKAGK